MSIKEAAAELGVSQGTLRRWEREGKIQPERTQGGTRRYSMAILRPVQPSKISKPTIGYARVSNHDQKDDLVRQEQMLEMYCASQGWQFKIISDLGSGMNYRKHGLKKILSMIINEEISRLVLTHKDRLLRFGAELIFTICEEKNVEVVIINQGDESTFEEELAKDVLEIITVFSAKLYGSRNHKIQHLLKKLEEVTKAK